MSSSMYGDCRLLFGEQSSYVRGKIAHVAGKFAGADDERTFVGRIWVQTVAASDESRIDRNDVHLVTKPEFLLRDSCHCAKLAGREQLAGVIPRLAMNIDRAGEVGRGFIVEPIVVREPAVRSSQRN